MKLIKKYTISARAKILYILFSFVPFLLSVFVIFIDKNALLYIKFVATFLIIFIPIGVTILLRDVYLIDSEKIIWKRNILFLSHEQTFYWKDVYRVDSASFMFLSIDKTLNIYSARDGKVERMVILISSYSKEFFQEVLNNLSSSTNVDLTNV